MSGKRIAVAVAFATALLAASVGRARAQAVSNTPTFSLANGTSFIAPTDLPPALGAALQQMGGRMTNATTAAITLIGTVTDSKGSRAAQITVQAPGYLSYSEGTTRILTFNGIQLQTNSGQPTTSDEAVFESLLANLPDAMFLQLATGGSVRRLGSHFRADNGKTPGYTGPYWTMYAFSPRNRSGLTQGKALQEQVFIAVDEKTGLVDDIRTVVNTSPQVQSVTQTEFSNWMQQGSQWFPGKIVRLEDGTQTLSFQTTQASVGPALSLTAFQP